MSGDPAIGLKIGSEQRMERYDPIGIAALYARSFRDALQRLARYKQLTCPPEIRLMYQGDECAVQFQWLLARESEPAVLIDVCFAWIVAIGRRGTGVPLTPLRLELARPAREISRIDNDFAKLWSQRRRAISHVARNPPSMGRASPLSIAAASVSKKQTTDAISSHSANLPNGIR